MLDDEAKARFKAIGGFVANESQIAARHWNLNAKIGAGQLALLGRAQEGFATKKRIGEGADVIVFSVFLTLPTAFHNLEVFRFANESFDRRNLFGADGN